MAGLVAAPALTRLPLVTLYLTDRCNSRCITCDYWRHGRDTMTLEALRALLPDLRALQTQMVLLSGGEPLLHPEWPEIARELRANGQKVWLLTSGLALAKHVRRACSLLDAITVSLDGSDGATYRLIRGLDGFETVCAGIRAAAAGGLAPGVRVTLQKHNFRQLPRFISLAAELGARQVSFLAVNVDNVQAFGRDGVPSQTAALSAAEALELTDIIEGLRAEYAEAFASGFIAESPAKLKRIAQYFSALHDAAAYPPVRCNAPEFSAVVTPRGQVQPCFFVAGPAQARLGHLPEVLNGAEMRTLRHSLGSESRPECKTCVCSMWRDPAAVHFA